MKKKYNNNSIYFKDWTTKKLKDEAVAYYQSIYITQCYGMKDMKAYYGIMDELDRRGVKYQEKLVF
jgi:hypothetical protein